MVYMATGSLRSFAEVPVFLSLNGQQFDANATRTFGYRSPPVVSLVTPHAGPIAMNTSVVVHGANLGGGSRHLSK